MRFADPREPLKRNIALQQPECELLIETNPLGKFTSIEEKAALAISSCLHSAQNMTGVPISNDCGWTARPGREHAKSKPWMV